MLMIADEGMLPAGGMDPFFQVVGRFHKPLAMLVYVCAFTIVLNNKLASNTAGRIKRLRKIVLITSVLGLQIKGWNHCSQWNRLLNWRAVEGRWLDSESDYVVYLGFLRIPAQDIIRVLYMQVFRGFFLIIYRILCSKVMMGEFFIHLIYISV